MTVSVQQDAILGKFSVLAYKDKTDVIETLRQETVSGGSMAGWKVLDSKQEGAFTAYAFRTR